MSEKEFDARRLGARETISADNPWSCCSREQETLCRRSGSQVRGSSKGQSRTTTSHLRCDRCEQPANALAIISPSPWPSSSSWLMLTASLPAYSHPQKLTFNYLIFIPPMKSFICIESIERNIMGIKIYAFIFAIIKLENKIETPLITKAVYHVVSNARSIGINSSHN